MKRLLAVTLCLGLIFAAGCRNSNSPETREKKLTQDFLESKYVSGNIDGTLKMNMDNMGEQTLNINSTFQSDTSTGFPKFKMDGNVSLGDVMSLPLIIYADESGWSTTMLGHTQSHEIAEDRRNQIRFVTEQLIANQASISRTVKETTRNEKNALEIRLDVNQTNSLFANSGNPNNSVEQFTMYYILNENNEIEQIEVETIMTIGQRMEIHLFITPTSIGQPFEITPLT